ncbi:DUF4179 domain-containing protein [Agathobaculum desmolans]|uniref:DUF4179 domain-containing protein n=1 Tax=Agathobaculum desmolans TaxID=39484 RepID=UPI00248F0F47|nr:DUF4179 domain-containing protein [Agathobaculum desmolans]
MSKAYNEDKSYQDAMNELHFSEEAKQRMANRLNDSLSHTGQPARRRTRGLPRMAAVGVAAALVLGVGAGATGVLKTAGEAFAGVFGPTADTEIIDKIGRPVGASDTDNGVTVTADAILFDGYNYVLTYSLVREDGQPFDVQEIPDGDKLDLLWNRWSSDIGSNTSGGHGGSYFFDENPEDPAIQYVETMSYNEAVETGGTAKVMFGDLRTPEKVIAEGTWRVKFKLNAENLSVELPAGQEITLDGMTGTVEQALVSPMGYHFVYSVNTEASFDDAPSGKQPQQHEEEWMRLSTDYGVRLTDGTVIDLRKSGNGGSMDVQDGKTICIRGGVFDELIPLEQIDAVLLGGIEIPVVQ